MQNLLNEKQAAEWLGVSVATLRAWRSTRRVSLPYVKLGKACRYRPEDIERFIVGGTVGVVSYE